MCGNDLVHYTIRNYNDSEVIKASNTHGIRYFDFLSPLYGQNLILFVKFELSTTLDNKRI
jgi:hypothetical protein